MHETKNVPSHMKPSTLSPAKTRLLPAMVMCAIAWQQALPEVLLSSQVETDSTVSADMRSVLPKPATRNK